MLIITRKGKKQNRKIARKNNKNYLEHKFTAGSCSHSRRRRGEGKLRAKLIHQQKYSDNISFQVLNLFVSRHKFHQQKFFRAKENYFMLEIFSSIFILLTFKKGEGAILKATFKQLPRPASENAKILLSDENLFWFYLTIHIHIASRHYYLITSHMIITYIN